ncbi:MAG: hypothetical protein AB7V00_01115 [Bacilli bacterium]
MFLEIGKETLVLILLALCLLPIIGLMLYAIIVALKKRNKLSQAQQVAIAQDTDTTQSQLFFQLFGQKDNIVAVTQEMSRVSVQVKDLSKVSLEELKNQGATGILVVGDTVKCAFGDRAVYIYNILKEFSKNDE